MTPEERKQLIASFEEFIDREAKGQPLMKSEIKDLLNNYLSNDDEYVVIQWPEIQELMEEDGFENNAALANAGWCLDCYGSSAYFVNKQWLNEIIF